MGEEMERPRGLPVDVTVRYPVSYDPAVDQVTLRGPSTEFPMEPLEPGVWILRLESGDVHEWLYPALDLDGSIWYPDGCEDGGSDSRERVWLSPTWFTQVSSETDTGFPGDDPDEDPTPDADDGSGDAPGIDDHATPAPEAEDPAEDIPCGCQAGGGSGHASLLTAALAILAQRAGRRRAKARSISS
jgi:hypothetical protein